MVSWTRGAGGRRGKGYLCANGIQKQAWPAATKSSLARRRIARSMPRSPDLSPAAPPTTPRASLSPPARTREAVRPWRGVQVPLGSPTALGAFGGAVPGPLESQRSSRTRSSLRQAREQPIQPAVAAATPAPALVLAPAAVRAEPQDARPMQASPRVLELAAYNRGVLLRCYFALQRAEEANNSTRSRLPFLMPCVAEAQPEPPQPSMSRRCHSASTRRTTGPTWQVPLQTDLLKGGNSDYDEWKGMKSKAAGEPPILAYPPMMRPTLEAHPQLRADFVFQPVRAGRLCYAAPHCADDIFSQLARRGIMLPNVRGVPGMPGVPVMPGTPGMPGIPMPGVPGKAQVAEYAAAAAASTRLSSVRSTSVRRSLSASSLAAVAGQRHPAMPVVGATAQLSPSGSFQLRAMRRARTVGPGDASGNERPAREHSQERGSLRGFRRALPPRDRLGIDAGPPFGSAVVGGQGADRMEARTPRGAGERADFRHPPRPRSRDRFEGPSEYRTRASGEFFQRLSGVRTRGERPGATAEGADQGNRALGGRDEQPLLRSPTGFQSAAMRSASADPRCLESRPVQLKREVRALLNKISPENEASIVSQLAALHLEGAEDFELIADLMLEKAINDPFYSEVYAQAIRKLSMEYALLPVRQRGELTSSHSATSGSSRWGVGGFTSFGETIVERCRRTFNKFFGDPQTLAGDVEEDEDDGKRTRLRAQAYVRLLGNLYVGRIICADSLQHCINTLLMIPGDKERAARRPCPPKAWIECTCELVYAVGKDLSRSAEGRGILRTATTGLGELKELRRESSLEGGPSSLVLPPRLQFMIQDVIEAGRRGWQQAGAEDKGVPEKSKCKMTPTRAPQHFV